MTAPYYRFFVGDYMRDAGHLSLLEHGVYRRLIDIYMAQGEALPFDMPRLYRLLHATSKEEQVAVQVVIEEFFRMDRQALRHKRCDAELRWQSGVREASEKANRIRWEKERHSNQEVTSDRSPTGVPSDSDRHPYQNQNQNQKEQKDKKDKPGAAFGRARWVPPEGVLPETWAAWLDVRQTKRQPWTENAYNLALKSLAEVVASGHLPERVVAYSAMKGYQGLWAPQTSTKTPSSQSLDFATGKGCR